MILALLLSLMAVVFIVAGILVDREGSRRAALKHGYPARPRWEDIARK